MPVQSRGAAAYRAVHAAHAMILAHMVMNGGKGKEGLAGMGSRQRQADKARQDKAVVAKQAGVEADRHRPCSKTAGR